MEQQVPGLRDAARVLWRRKLTVAAATIAVTGAAFAYSSAQPNHYTAAASLVVSAIVPPVAIGPVGGAQNGGSLGLDQKSDTLARVLKSTAMADRVRKRLGTSKSTSQLLSVIHVRKTADQVLEVDASAATPAEAVAIADGFATELLTFRREQAEAALQAIAADLMTSVSVLQERIDTLDKQIIENRERIAAYGSGNDLSSQQLSERAGIQALVDRMTEERNDLLARSGDLRSRAAALQLSRAGSVGGGQVLPAATPGKKSSPKPLRDMAAGIALGLLLGAMLAFVRDQLDRRIRGSRDAALAADSAVLVTIPRGLLSAPGGAMRLADPASAAGARFRALRAGLAAMGLGDGVRVLAIVSPDGSAVSAPAAANLAMACGNAGMNTLVASAAAGGSRLGDILGIPESDGLTSIVGGRSRLADAIRGTGQPLVTALPAGPPAAPGSDPLASPVFSATVAETAARWDVVLLETAPVDQAEGIAALGTADAALLVLRANLSTRAAASRTSALLAQAGTPLLGVVLLAASPGDEGTAGYQMAPAPARRDASEGAGYTAASNGNGNGVKRATARTAPVAVSPSPATPRFSAVDPAETS